MGTRRKLSIVVDAEYNGGREIKTAADSIERLGLESDIAAERQKDFTKRQKELARAVSDGEKSFDDAAREMSDYRKELGLVERQLEETDRAQEKLSDTAGTGGDAFDKMSSGARNLGAALLPATVAVAGIGLAAAKTWEQFNEGAALVASEQKFYALADSIGASDSALAKLRTETGNMISDAELMAGANELISFGIAKNEEDMLGWSNVVSKLDLDLQVLGLTLANNSVARLDSLGLSMEDVKKRTDEFVKAGKSADEAFDLAVYDALNDRVDLLGDSLGGAASDAKVLAAEMQNIKNEAQRATAAGLGPLVSSLSANIKAQNLAQDAMKRGIITQEEWNEITQSGSGFLEFNASVLANLEKAIREAERGYSDSEATIIAYYQGMATGERATFDLTNATNTYAESARALTEVSQQNYKDSIAAAQAAEIETNALTKKRDAVLEARAAQQKHDAAMGDFFVTALESENALVQYNRVVSTTGGLTQSQSENLSDLRAEQTKILDNINSLQGGTASLNLSEDELNEKLTEQHEALATVNAAMEPLAGVTAEITGVNESYAVNQDAVNSSLFKAADAAGASATEMALLGLATGDLTADQAEAALKSAALQSEILKLGDAIANGMDPTEALNRLQAFQDGLEAQDFSVKLGIDVEESTDKARGKTDETLTDFSTMAEIATGEASAFFGVFADDVGGYMGLVDEAFKTTTEEMTGVSNEAIKIKDTLFALTENTHVVKVRFETEGRVPSVPGGAASGTPGGSAAANSTSVADEMAQ